MSVSKWRYTEDCDGDYCIGDCDLCSKNNEEKTITDNIIWQYKDNEPIDVQIDDFIKTQIGLCLLGMEGESE